MQWHNLHHIAVVKNEVTGNLSNFSQIEVKNLSFLDLILEHLLPENEDDNLKFRLLMEKNK
jgi:hypothetical protein